MPRFLQKLTQEQYEWLEEQLVGEEEIQHRVRRIVDDAMKADTDNE